MRTVNYRDGVLYPIARGLGFEPARQFPHGEVEAVVDTINSRVRFGWEFYPWPEFTITEERAFRQVWSALLNYMAGTAPDEFYYIPNKTYYRTIADAPAGTLPTNLTYFAPIAEPLDRYLAYDQYGKTAIGKIIEVNRLDPRVYKIAPFTYNTNPSGYGIDLPYYAVGPTVWVTFEPLQPQFSAAQYDVEHEYLRDDVVYDPVTGECYRARISSLNQPVDQTLYWSKQAMPFVLAEYVKTGDDNALRKQVDNLLEQGTRHFYGRRNYRCGYPQIGFGPPIPWLVEVPVLVP